MSEEAASKPGQHGSQQIYDIIIYIYLLQRGSHIATATTTTNWILIFVREFGSLDPQVEVRFHCKWPVMDLE